MAEQLEEEKAYLIGLLDQIFDDSVSVIERMQLTVQVEARLRNFAMGEILPQQTAQSEIYPPNPKKVVTDL